MLVRVANERPWPALSKMVHRPLVGGLGEAQGGRQGRQMVVSHRPFWASLMSGRPAGHCYVRSGDPALSSLKAPAPQLEKK